MKTVFLLLFVIAAQHAFCQKKEYLIKQNGDTLFGEIVIMNKNVTITGASANSVVLSADDVKKIHSPKYKGQIVLPYKLHTYTDELTELQTNSYRNSLIDTVVVLDEVYTTPKMNLYFCKDVFKRQYYFYKTPADSLPIQLFVNYSLSGEMRQNLTAIYSDFSSVTHVEIQKGYVNQLKLAMGDCNKIPESEWDALDYRIYSLKDIVKKYNKCK
jgi:hypothetical protein